MFPIDDVVGADGAPAPASVHEFIADLISTKAAIFDRGGVPREVLLELGTRGLLGTPHEPPEAQRELTELIAGADGDTWFCWAQHATPLRTLDAASSPGAWAARWLTPLQTGTAIAAVAFAHLRRPDHPNPVAHRDTHGWRISGTLDWVTSWDIADVVLIMARVADHDRVLQVLIPAGHGTPLAGVSVGPILDLVAMRGTHTRPARLADVFVPDEYVVDVVDFHDWRRSDDAKTVDASPAIFGVTRGAVAQLAQLAQQRSSPTLHHLAQSLTTECRQVRARAYALAADEEQRDARLGLRAHALDLVLRASSSVITAQAGSAMLSGEDAERRMRTALFLQVQAQTGLTREASLRYALSQSESLVE